MIRVAPFDSQEGGRGEGSVGEPGRWERIHVHCSVKKFLDVKLILGVESKMQMEKEK